MFKRTIIILMALAIALTLLAGCQSQQSFRLSQLDENWGRSFAAAKNSQILNPDAGKNTDPVTGLDGELAIKKLQQYRSGKTVKADDGNQPVTYTIQQMK